MVAQNIKLKRRVLLGFVSIASVAALVGSMFAMSQNTNSGPGATLATAPATAAAFDKNAANVFTAAYAVGYENGEGFVTTTDYVTDNMDRGLVGDAELKAATNIVVSYTRMTGEAKSIADLWENHSDDFAGQFSTAVALFDAGDGKYLVGNVGPDEPYEFVEMEVGPYAIDGTTFDGAKFDAKTGLVYIPKDKAIENKDKGLRMQILGRVADDNQALSGTTTMDLKMNAGNYTDVTPSGTVTTSALGQTRIIIAGENVLGVDDIEQVKVNGIDLSGYDTGLWSFDPASGELFVDQDALLVHDVEVSLRHRSVASAAAIMAGDIFDKAFGVENAYAADVNGYKRPYDGKYGGMNSVDKNGQYHEGHLYRDGFEVTWDFNGAPKEGQIVDFETDLWYADADQAGNLNGVWKNLGDGGKGPGNGNIGGALPLLPRDPNTYGKGTDDTAIGTSMIADSVVVDNLYNYLMNNGAKVSTSNLHHQYIGNFLNGQPNPAGQTNPYYGLNFAVNQIHEGVVSKSDKGSTGGVKIPLFAATLQCGHMSNPVHGFDDKGSFASNENNTGRRVRVKVMQVDAANHTALIGMATPDSNSQAGVGMFYIKYVEPMGRINLVKHSANPAYSDKNNAYSMEGIEYKVYSDEACTKEVTTLTLDAAGRSQTVDIKAGNYWVKETKTNDGYELNKTVYKVTVAPGQTATVQ